MHGNIIPQLAIIKEELKAIQDDVFDGDDAGTPCVLSVYGGWSMRDQSSFDDEPTTPAYWQVTATIHVHTDCDELAKNLEGEMRRIIDEFPDGHETKLQNS